MIKLKRLYSVPEVFTPVPFESGMNIILGERSEQSNKTNAVGKSISIEFLDFCLLKGTYDSRVTRIPDGVLDPNVIISLDLELNNYKITISRTKGEPEVIVIHKDGEEIILNGVDEASEYLGNLYFENYSASTTRITFRNLLAPLLRDEKSEFKDIIKCFDTDKTIPRDFTPHLFFLGLDVDLYITTKKIIDKLERKKDYFSETKRILTNNNEIKVNDAKAKLNELTGEVNKINDSIEKLKSNESFESAQNDIIGLESKLSKLRLEQKAIKFEIKQITSLPAPENISEKEIVILFNQFKKGLGDLVEKSLIDLKDFRQKIDGFRNTLVNKKLRTLRAELVSINGEATKLDNELSRRLQLIDSTGKILGDLKTSISIFANKNEELSNLSGLISRYDSAERDKKELEMQRAKNFGELDSEILSKQEVIKSFEDTILEIHEKIFGNKRAYFDIITVSSRKDILEFDLRTDDDRSWSVERMKVFIYDTALLFNANTKKNHPGFLVHDNLFNVDNDSLVKCLNFLYHQEVNHPEEFQYILTINRDMIEILEHTKKIDFDINSHIRAKYTKNSRFLKKQYTEAKRKRK